MRIISTLCLMALAIAYFYIGHSFIEAMGSTRVADLGSNDYDIVCLMIAIVFGLSGCFVLALTAWLNGY